MNIQTYTYILHRSVSYQHRILINFNFFVNYHHNEKIGLGVFYKYAVFITDFMPPRRELLCTNKCQILSSPLSMSGRTFLRQTSDAGYFKHSFLYNTHLLPVLSATGQNYTTMKMLHNIFTSQCQVLIL